MQIKALTTISLALSALAMPTDISNSLAQVTLPQVDSFLQGFLFALTNKDFSGFGTCVNDVQTIGNDIIQAVNEFKLETFDGVKQGLNEIGIVAKLVPGALKDCKMAVGELE